MVTEASVLIDAPREVVWRLSTDIEHSARTIDGIEKVDILERPEQGIVGLKWVETRTLFGKSATETMWVTEAQEPSHYAVAARSHGTRYRTDIRMQDEDAGTRLSMRFEGVPEKPVSRIMAFLFGPFMKRSVAKALQKDLEDVKRAAEGEAGL